jgi:hypothetical protein
MQRHDIDWHYLAEGMALRLVVCALMLAALGASYWARADYAAASDSRREQLQALEQQRAALAERLQAREEFEPRFAALRAAGVVGEEQRLVLAQALRDSASELHLPYLRFTAGPRHPFTAPYLVPGQAAPVLATTVDVQAGLVHELDLLRFVDQLREQAPGFFSVAGCSLERVGQGVAPEADKANLAGICTLRWYSIPLDAPPAMAAEGGE